MSVPDSASACRTMTITGVLGTKRAETCSWSQSINVHKLGKLDGARVATVEETRSSSLMFLPARKFKLCTPHRNIAAPRPRDRDRRRQSRVAWPCRGQVRVNVA